MKNFLCMLLTLGATINASAQVPDQLAAKQGAFAAAKNMDESLIQQQYTKYVSYVHPDILARTAGGADGMVSNVSKQMAGIRETGNVITAVWPKMPDVVIDTAGEWQTAIQQYMTYRLPEGQIKSVTTIIGISPDKGNKWYFMDAAGRSVTDMKKIFPTLSSKLVIPPPTPPEMMPDNPATGKGK